jgi:hypothetical protein
VTGLILRARQGGKTTELIRQSAETGAYIVCTTHQNARRIARQAEDMELSIPFPLTATEWRSGAYYPRGVRGLLFDDLDRIVQYLSSVPVLGATWTDDGEAVPA